MKMGKNLWSSSHLLVVTLDRKLLAYKMDNELEKLIKLPMPFQVWCYFELLFSPSIEETLNWLLLCAISLCWMLISMWVIVRSSCKWMVFSHPFHFCWHRYITTDELKEAMIAYGMGDDEVAIDEILEDVDTDNVSSQKKKKPTFESPNWFS